MRSAMPPAPRSGHSRSHAKRCCARCTKPRLARRSDVELLQPSSTEEATGALGNGSRALAGGTELVPLLREAANKAASPQLRSMGTIGGNLLQATRCWYWRLGFDCWLHGGERCFAKDGANREHAIFGNERCASAHPSDVAAALLALGATVRTTRRELPLAELYRLPTQDDRSTTTLAEGELILELEVPVPDAST